MAPGAERRGPVPVDAKICFIDSVREKVGRKTAFGGSLEEGLSGSAGGAFLSTAAEARDEVENNTTASVSKIDVPLNHDDFSATERIFCGW
jgi:hypothetical protein